MDVDGILSAIVAGLVIGWLGARLAPGKHRRIGLTLTILIGIVGALVGEAVAGAVGVDGFVLTFVIQLVAAAALVTFFRVGSRR